MAELDPSQRGANRVRTWAKTALSIVALAASGVALEGCSKSTPIKPLGKAARQALNNYDASFEKASPLKKYLEQYINPQYEYIYKYTSGDTLSSSPTIYDYQFTINNGCLSGTPYNPNRNGLIVGTSSGSGLFSTSSGNVKGSLPQNGALPIYSLEHPDKLKIIPSDPQTPDLLFTGAEQGAKRLHYANPETASVLVAYGCLAGIVEHTSGPG